MSKEHFSCFNGPARFLPCSKGTTDRFFPRLSFHAWNIISSIACNEIFGLVYLVCLKIRCAFVDSFRFPSQIMGSMSSKMAKVER